MEKKLILLRQFGARGRGGFEIEILKPFVGGGKVLAAEIENLLGSRIGVGFVENNPEIPDPLLPGLYRIGKGGLPEEEQEYYCSLRESEEKPAPYYPAGGRSLPDGLPVFIMPDGKARA